MCLQIHTFKRSPPILQMRKNKLLISSVPPALMLRWSHDRRFIFRHHQLTRFLYHAQSLQRPVILFLAHLIGANVHFVWKVHWGFFEWCLVENHWVWLRQRLLRLFWVEGASFESFLCLALFLGECARCSALRARCLGELAGVRL